MADDERSQVDPNLEGTLGHPDGGAELPKDEDDDDIPPPPIFLQDEAPKGVTNYVKWALMHGKMEEDLIGDGLNPGTIRIAAQYLEKEGYRKRPKADKNEKAIMKMGSSAVKTTTQTTVAVAKGSSPEQIINGISIPVVGAEQFEKGMKFGMSMTVFAVRIVQELSALGVVQTKPIIDMARTMREGEALAAKAAGEEAASKAAQEAADSTAAGVVPFMQDIAKQMTELKKANENANPNPMRDMMMETMKPIFQDLMGKVAGGIVPGASGGTTSKSGWERKVEE